MALLSKIKVGATEYNLKDAQAREDLTSILGGHTVEALGAAAWKAVATEISGDGLVDASTVKSYVDSQVGQVHSFDIVIDTEGTNEGPSVAASADTMYTIYMVPDSNASAGTYVEWITIRSGEASAYTYAWEKIGSTKTDLTGYVSKDTTIAGLKLDHNITDEELETALGLGALAYKASASGTVAGQTITGVKATGTTTGTLTGDMAYDSTAITSTGDYTPAGSVTGTVVATGTVATEISMADANATLTKADYTPAGSVQVTPATATASVVTSAGTAAQFTEGAFTAATLTHSEDTFAKSGVNVAIDETDEEMLVISSAATGTASNITAFSGGSKAADTFVANTPAVFDNVNVVTGITSAAFTGTKAEGALVTGVSYQKAGEATSVFTGNAEGDAITAAFAGNAAEISVAGNYDKANLGTVAFSGAAVELAVGDIAVAAKDVTVQ